MAEFENINSPAETLSLEKEIQFAVTQAVQPLVCTGAWRTYTGPCQERLASQLSEVLGARHVGLACSGSAALETILRACKVDSGDEVLLAAYDYPGNFTAIENCRARPALVDLAAHSWNLCLESLEATWTPACKVLIASHLHGQLQDMLALQQWCQTRNVVLIQDACQALGASIQQQPLGHWADATIISFGGSKVISTGRGGAWCTNSEKLSQHARIAAGVGSGAFELSELQAAMALAQLPFLARITTQCRGFFAELQQSFKLEGLFAPWSNQLENTAFYQAGWLTRESDPPTTHTTCGVIPLGRGFDGFHRRSTRRCRAHKLTNVANVVSRTVTIHHRAALTG